MAKHSINENYNGQTKLRHWWTVIRDNLSNLLGWYNSHIDGTADRHRAEDIDYDDSGTVKEKINKIDMSLFKQTKKLPDEILTPGFYYGVGVVNGTLGGSGTYWFAIEIYPVFSNLLQILHQNVNGEWTTYCRNVSGLESDTPQFTEWVWLAKISDVTALRTEVINQIGDPKNLTTVEKENLVNAINEVNQKIANEVNTRIEADETIRKEIPVKTIENITSETTDNSSYVTPLVVKNAISNLVESSEEIKNIADNLAQKADKVTNGGFIAGGAEAGKLGSISIGSGIGSTGEYGIAIGAGAEGANDSVAIGHGSIASGIDSVAIGDVAESLAKNAVQICEGSNSESESLQFRKYKIVRYDTTDDEYYLKDVGRLSRLYTTNQSNIVEAINELSLNKGNNASKAVLGEVLSKSEEFNVWQNGNWIVGYSIPNITITDDTYGTFSLPSQMLEAAGVKEEAGEEKKYCYASYTLNTDNLSGEISGSDMTVTCGLKEAKGKPNSYMEIEDETKLTTINIYLGTITLNSENDLLPDGTVSVIYSGSETTNESVEINLLKIFNTSGSADVFIDDNTAGNDTTYSSSKINALLAELEKKINTVPQVTQITPLTTWNFYKTNSAEAVAVTLPHTCNGVDGESANYYRGTATYTRSLNLTATQANNTSYLCFSKAGQKCTVKVNGHTLPIHYGGYTPFVFDVSNYLNVGDNTITVICDNSLDWDLAPISGDFIFCNGLYDNVYLVNCANLYFDTEKYGMDRLHITQSEVSEASAKVLIEASVKNSGNNISSGTIVYEIKDMDGTVVFSDTENISIDGKSSYDFAKNITLQNPTLWDGFVNPYLYTITVTLKFNDNVIDACSHKLGLRYYELSGNNGFKLNGKQYLLRGFAMHQDYENVGSAATNELIDKDLQIVIESGANMLRLAHYPHNDYIYQRCDELGIIVQTEIPWVNHCGVNATTAYFNNIKNNMKEMIINYYNHPSIIFFGMSNELGGSHLSGVTNQQGDYDYDNALIKTRELYNYAKALTSQHLIGIVAHDPTFKYVRSKIADWSFLDWVGLNIYKGWYGGNFTDFTTMVNEYHNSYPNLCICEYGAGANTDSHSETPETTTNTGSGGMRHDEEYQNLFHESYLSQIDQKPGLIFTTAWCLFDFAVSGRNEGGLPYINDKGLVTRDRTVKKDAFYLYKSYFSDVPTVYITSRRFNQRATDSIKIKVYSNCDTLKLYQNGNLIQKLTAASSLDCVWEFDRVNFVNRVDEFTVKGTKNNIEYTDTVNFSTTNIAVTATDFTVGNNLVVLSNDSPSDNLDIALVPENSIGSVNWAGVDGVSIANNTVTLIDTSLSNVVKNLDGTLSGTEITKTVPCAINCDYYCNVKTTGASGAVVPEVIMDTSGLGNNLMLSGFANTADSGYNKYGVLKLSGTETVKLDNPILPHNKPYTIHLLTGSVSYSIVNQLDRVITICDNDNNDLFALRLNMNSSVRYYKYLYKDTSGNIIVSSSIDLGDMGVSNALIEVNITVNNSNIHLQLNVRNSNDPNPIIGTYETDITTGISYENGFNIQLLNNPELTAPTETSIKKFWITSKGV